MAMMLSDHVIPRASSEGYDVLRTGTAWFVILDAVPEKR
jgi:hypothetical protein